MQLTLRASSLRTWLITFSAVFALSAVWALSTPYFAGIDEVQHVIRAYSVSHGEILGVEPTSESITSPDYPGSMVRVPRQLATPGPDGIWSTCYESSFNRSAKCFSLATDNGEVMATTSAGRHPPLYYFVAGLPTWLSSSSKGLIAMRMISGLLAAAFIASAMVSALESSARRFLPLGILLGCTPTALALFGVVNPNGVEIAAAIGVWVNGVILAREEPSSRRVMYRFGVALLVLILTRHLGPLWAAVLLVVLGVIAGWSRLSALAGRRAWRVLGISAIVAAVGQTAWVIGTDALNPFHNLVAGNPPTDWPASDIQRREIANVLDRLVSAIAKYGFSGRMPQYTILIWLCMLAVVIVVAFFQSPKRFPTAVSLTALAVICIPIALEYPRVREAGFFFSGRYVLPLIVGIPILACAGISQSSLREAQFRRSGPVLIGSLILSAQVVGYWQVIRRYSVGQNGTLWYWTSPDWSPQSPFVVLLIGFVLAYSLLCWICVSPVGAATSESQERFESFMTVNDRG